MSIVMRKKGQECWWWGSKLELNNDQVSGVRHKGVNKVMGRDNEHPLVW